MRRRTKAPNSPHPWQTILDGHALSRVTKRPTDTSGTRFRRQGFIADRRVHRASPIPRTFRSTTVWKAPRRRGFGLASDANRTGLQSKRRTRPSSRRRAGSLRTAKKGLRYPGQTSQFPEWVELDLQGNLTGRWKIGEWNGGGYGYTADRQLYSYPYNRDLKRGELKVFDRATSSWKPVENGPNVSGFLLGADGNSLVFDVRRKGSVDGVHTVWFKADPAEGNF